MATLSLGRGVNRDASGSLRSSASADAIGSCATTTVKALESISNPISP